MNQDTTLDRTRTDGQTSQRSQSRGGQPLQRDETNNLISSSKVDGTAVYSTDGEKIGSVNHLMIGKRSGRVEYAVMSFGGFLGMGENFHPLPWDALDYDTDRGGYVVNIDKNRLKDAPTFERDRQPSFDRQYGEQVYNYYGFIY